MSAHHFTCPHSTMHIATFKYKIHITLPTAHIPYHTTHPTLHFDHHSACLIGPRQTIPHYSVLLPQPHFTSCISTPPHHSTSHHNISHLTLHDITASHRHWCRTYSTLHLTSPHHSHRVNKVQHPTSGIAKRCTSHQIWHHAVWSGGIEIREMWCDVEWCAVPEMWYWAVVMRFECQCNTLSLRHLAPRHIIPPHFTLHHLTISTSHGHIPRHTIIPHHIAHFISHQHLSQYTIPLCNTIFKIAPLISTTLCITPHLALHPILHYVPHNATFHVLHATFKITPYIGHTRSRSLVVGPRGPTRCVFTIACLCTCQFTMHTTETAFGTLTTCCGLYFSQFDKSLSADMHCVFGPFSATVGHGECPLPTPSFNCHPGIIVNSKFCHGRLWGAKDCYV